MRWTDGVGIKAQCPSAALFDLSSLSVQVFSRYMSLDDKQLVSSLIRTADVLSKCRNFSLVLYRFDYFSLDVWH